MRRLIWPVFLLFLISCSDDGLVQRKLPEQELTEALKLFKDEDYLDAEKRFLAITIRHAGTEVAETAQYYYAECNFKMDEFLVAAESYREVYEKYKRSKYALISQFKEALSYEKLSPRAVLDQRYTHKALRLYENYVKDHPKAADRDKADKSIFILKNRLGEKIYQSAYIYYRMSRYRAAMKYIDIVKSRHADTEANAKAYLLVVKINVERERWVQAQQALDLFKSKFPEKSKNNAELDELQVDITEGKLELVNG